MNKMGVYLTLFDSLLEKRMFVGHHSPPETSMVFVTLHAHAHRVKAFGFIHKGYAYKKIDSAR